MAISLVKETPVVRVGTCGPVLICVWSGQATIASLQLVLDEQRKLAREYGPATMLAIAKSLPARPEPEVMQWLEDTDHVNDRSISATVVAILARGLGAVLARSFLAAVSLFSRKRLTVVKTIEEAATAVRQLPNQDARIVDRADFAADLDDFVEQCGEFARVG